MGVFENIFNYITGKNKSDKPEPNPELWHKFCQWDRNFLNNFVKELFVPSDITEKEAFEILEYVGKYHPRIKEQFTHIFFDKNIQNVPAGIFNGWGLEFVDFSKSPKLKIGSGAFANTSHLRIVNFFDPKHSEKDEKDAKLVIGVNAFANSGIESLISRIPTEFCMPIVKEIGRKQPFKLYIGDPDIIINGNEDEKYHNSYFILLSDQCVQSNPLFITLKKYGYNYEFSGLSNRKSSYFLDERYIKELLYDAFDKETNTLTLNNEIADKIEETKLIKNAILTSDGIKYNRVRENFDKIVFDIIKDNNFEYGNLKKLVFSVDNVELPPFCLAGNERVKEVVVDGTAICIERFALANSSVESISGNYIEIGHRAFWGSKITNLSIPASCKYVGTDIVDHQCKVLIESPSDTDVDSYFINPVYLAYDQPRRIIRRPVKNPTIHICQTNPSGIKKSIEHYGNRHRVAIKSQSRDSINFNDFSTMGK